MASRREGRQLQCRRPVVQTWRVNRDLGVVLWDAGATDSQHVISTEPEHIVTAQAQHQLRQPSRRRPPRIERGGRTFPDFLSDRDGSQGRWAR